MVLLSRLDEQFHWRSSVNRPTAREHLLNVVGPEVDHPGFVLSSPCDIDGIPGEGDA